MKDHDWVVLVLVDKSRTIYTMKLEVSRLYDTCDILSFGVGFTGVEYSIEVGQACAYMCTWKTVKFCTLEKGKKDKQFRKLYHVERLRRGLKKVETSGQKTIAICRLPTVLYVEHWEKPL